MNRLPIIHLCILILGIMPPWYSMIQDISEPPQNPPADVMNC